MKYPFFLTLLHVVFFIHFSSSQTLVPQEMLQLQQGEEKTLHLEPNTDRVLVGTSGIVSLLMPDRQTVTLRGIKPGFTTLTVRTQTGVAKEYAVRVKQATSQVLEEVAKEIRNYLVDLSGLTVNVREDKIVLSGKCDPAFQPYYRKITEIYGDLIIDVVDFTPAINAATALAEVAAASRSSSTKEVPTFASQGVRIDCQVVEVSIDSTSDLGIAWFPGGQPWSIQGSGGLSGSTQMIGTPGASNSGGTQNGGTSSSSSSSGSGTSSGTSVLNSIGGSSSNPAPASQQLNLGGNVNISNLNFNLITLARKGKARLLATPKLTVESGKKASFLVGGEVPIVSTTPTSSSVNYKKFGTQLEIAPEIRSADQIFLNVTATISDLDFGRAVQGNPTLTTREAMTNVTIKDNVTFAIAGLMSRNTGKSAHKIPILGDLPLVGYLFKSEQNTVTDVETIVIITPQIIRNHLDSTPDNAIPLSPEIEKAKKDLAPAAPAGAAKSS